MIVKDIVDSLDGTIAVVRAMARGYQVRHSRSRSPFSRHVEGARGAWMANNVEIIVLIVEDDRETAGTPGQQHPGLARVHM